MKNFVLLASLSFQFFTSVFAFDYNKQVLPISSPLNGIPFQLSQEDLKDISGLTGFLVGPNTQDINEKILKPFSSDGCSSAPDGIPLTDNDEAWQSCCIQHDTAYWLGGTKEQKSIADNNLKQCITAHDYQRIGKLYYWFVTRFSDPDTNSTYRWGYGWNVKRSYSPLTDVEKMLVVKMYGEPQDKFFSKLDTPSFKLVRNLIKTDFSLKPLNQAEKNVYNYFFKKLSAVSVIEYAQWGDWNSSIKELNVKLNSCDHLIKFTFNQDDESDFKVDNNCQQVY